MFKCFELVFRQLQLVKILCKLLIIWANYKKTKKGPFMKHRVHNQDKVVLIRVNLLVHALIFYIFFVTLTKLTLAVVSLYLKSYVCYIAHWTWACL